MLGAGPVIRSILPGVVQVPLRGSSAFILMDRRLTLVDTGLRGSGTRLLKAVRSCGRGVEEIERIIITHYHPDHLGSLPELQRVLPARTAIHAVEAPIVMSATGPHSPFANIALRLTAGPVLRRALPYTPSRIDEFLRDGDEFPVLGGLRVIHTPGHTPGHVALYFPEIALLIAGDALEHRGSVLSQPSRAFTADMSEARRSIVKLARLKIDVIAFSHFPPMPQGGRDRLREFTEVTVRAPRETAGGRFR